VEGRGLNQALGPGGAERTNGLCRAQAWAEPTRGVGRQPAPSRGGRGGCRTLPQPEHGGGRNARLARGSVGTGGDARLCPRGQRGSRGSGPGGVLSLASEEPGSAGWVPVVPCGCPEQAEDRDAACVWHRSGPRCPGRLLGGPRGASRNCRGG